MEVKFYRCNHCGNIVAFVVNKGVPVVCCGEKMQELKANNQDASTEKHVPVITREGNVVTVKVGSVEHPMTEEHFIQWVCLQTKFGNQRKALQPGQKPEVSFALLDGDEVEGAYAYCNLHSLWRD